MKVYFQPGSNADAAASTISNLGMADITDLPPGTLPPIVLRLDASSLPVCLVTLKGQGLSETALKDIAPNNIGTSRRVWQAHPCRNPSAAAGGRFSFMWIPTSSRQIN